MVTNTVSMGFPTGIKEDVGGCYLRGNLSV